MGKPEATRFRPPASYTTSTLSFFRYVPATPRKMPVHRSAPSFPSFASGREKRRDPATTS